MLIDTIGAMVAGSQESETQKLIQSLDNSGNGLVPVIGTDYTTDLNTAAFIHGVSAVAIELDEGNQWSKGHPAAHVVPLMLTLSTKSSDLEGTEFLKRLILSYEVCSRFGRAVTLLPGAHAHGTWGVLGAAAAAMFMKNVEQVDFLDGLRIGASFAMPTLWSSALQGKLIRNVYCGQAAESGLKVLSLLESGYLAPSETIEHVFSSVIGTEFNMSAFTLDEKLWDIERNYYKPYAFCRYAHAPIDAFRTIYRLQEVQVENIKTIDVYTYSRAATLSRLDYHNKLSAKFSIPYAIAVLAHEGKVDHSMFKQQLLSDENIRATAGKVRLHVSEELEQSYPSIMPAIVRVTDYSGRTWSERVDIAKGGPGKGLPELELFNKFHQLTSDVFNENIRAKIIDTIMHLEKHSMAELCELLTQCKTTIK